MYTERNTPNKFRICLVQTTSDKQGREHNLKRAAEAVKAAAAGGAILVVFPEMYIAGYEAGERLRSVCETADGPSFEAMAKFATENRINVIYGYPESRNGKIYNSANLIDSEGRLKGTYAKTRLFEGEKENFTPGSGYPVFDTDIGRIGMLICYDIEFPEPARRLAVKGADLIVCIAANMAPFHRLHARFSLIRAVENSVPVAYCNFTGNDDKFEYTGRSGLYEPSVELLSSPVDDMDKEILDERLIFAEMDHANYKREGTAYDYITQISPGERKMYQL